jgi:hypothetical protein
MIILTPWMIAMIATMIAVMIAVIAMITTTGAAALKYFTDIYIHIDCAANATDANINALGYS